MCEWTLNDISSFLFSADSGMGKTTALKHVALTWAGNSDGELRDKFQVAFHVALKHVKANNHLEEIIIAQHSGLKTNKVEPAEIKSILEDSNTKILLLIDGHDQYKTGCNTQIDEAIKKESLWNSWMILSSRETDDIRKLKKYMNVELEIKGFNWKGLWKYVTCSLCDETKMEEFKSQARRAGLMSESISPRAGGYEILLIPIILNILCVLFKSSQALPKTKTTVLKAVINRCIDRETIRAKGQKAVDRTRRAFHKLGELAWQGLCKPGRNLNFMKVFKSLYGHRLLLPVQTSSKLNKIITIYFRVK